MIRQSLISLPHPFQVQLHIFMHSSASLTNSHCPIFIFCFCMFYCISLLARQSHYHYAPLHMFCWFSPPPPSCALLVATHFYIFCWPLHNLSVSPNLSYNNDPPSNVASRPRPTLCSTRAPVPSPSVSPAEDRRCGASLGFGGAAAIGLTDSWRSRSE